MKKILAAILFFTAAVVARAQISVEVPSAVALDEQFNLTFVVEGTKPSSFDWQCPQDFQLVWGPQVGSSSSISIVNGKTNKSTQTSYTYVLMPRKEGTFQLPAATAKVGNKTLTSSVKTIKVAKSGAASASSTPTQQNAYSVSGEDLFMRLEVSRTKVVLGEPFTASIRLYQRVNIAGYEDFRLPSFDGFWSQVVASPQEIQFQRETIGDAIYNAATIRSYTLIPQQSGDLVIDPSELVCVLRVRNRSAASSIFDSFFQDDYSTIRKRVSTKPVTIHVSALPQPQPASFCGGVGKFSIKTMVTRDSLATHDAASLVVTVSGKGNLALIQAPKVNFPPDFEVYDVKSTDKDGSRVFEYPFIPRHYGDFVIPAVEFSYYDTASGRYETVSGEPIPVKVSRSEGDLQPSGGPSQLFSGVAGRDVRNLGTDIRYIATGNPGLTKAGAFFVCSTPFFIILAVLVLGVLALWVGLRKMAARRADVAGERKRGASKMARGRLARAGAFLKDNLYTAFYEELHRALLGFVADKFGIEASGQDKETISEKLLAAGIPDSDVKEFIGLLDACEFARYAPDAGFEAMDAHYKSALELISAIDESMKKRKHAGRGAAALAALLLMVPFAANAQTPDQVGGDTGSVIPDLIGGDTGSVIPDLIGGDTGSVIPNLVGGDTGSVIPDADRESLWQAGVDAYSRGEWSEARSAWEAVLAEGQESAALLTNIGSAYFKEGDLAHSILYFEKALKVDPSYDDAKYNLEFAQTFLKDRIESVPEFFVKGWIRSLRCSLSSNAWAIIFLVFLAIGLALLLLFLLGRSSAARKTGFFTGLAALLLAVLCLGFSLRLRSEYSAKDSAIVVSPVTVARSAPDNNSGTDLFILHEGTKVKVLDSVGSWDNIELSDGRQGWIFTNELEII
ncbi:MAG: BatD family protein [Bacteroidales bacterium]|nr:BatD family protein [Bacteroidales bacterium]